MEQDAINRVKYPQMGTLNDFENALRSKINEMELRRSQVELKLLSLQFQLSYTLFTPVKPLARDSTSARHRYRHRSRFLTKTTGEKRVLPGSTAILWAPISKIEFCLSPVDENRKPDGRARYRSRERRQCNMDQEPDRGHIETADHLESQPVLQHLDTEVRRRRQSSFRLRTVPDQSGLSGLNDVGGPASTDGVVVQYSSFGSVDKGTFPVMQAPYNHGRTLSHETVHWLGLRHIWGDGPCASDFVDDTPTQHAENRGCPATKISCDGVNVEMPQKLHGLLRRCLHEYFHARTEGPHPHAVLGIESTQEATC